MKLFGKYKKPELEDLIFNKNLSYREIGRMYGVSDAYIKKVCVKIGITLKKRKNLPDGWIPHNKGKVRTACCTNCNKDFILGYNSGKYCSKECETEYRKNTKYEHYLKNQEEYCKVGNMRFIKQHLLREQNNCCSICENENVSCCPS